MMNEVIITSTKLVFVSKAKFNVAYNSRTSWYVDQVLFFMYKWHLWVLSVRLKNIISFLKLPLQSFLRIRNSPPLWLCSLEIFNYSQWTVTALNFVLEYSVLINQSQHWKYVVKTATFCWGLIKYQLKCCAAFTFQTGKWNYTHSPL